jgi:hypothetical protein
MLNIVLRRVINKDSLEGVVYKIHISVNEVLWGLYIGVEMF